MMRAAKRDANEAEIIVCLEALGCKVDRLPGGNGRPDLDVAEPRHHSTFRIEVKLPGEGLNRLQKQYHATWPGRIHVVRTCAEAIEVARHYLNGGKDGDSVRG